MTTANMGLTVPALGTAGTTYAQNINDALSLIDAHTHAPGSGATLTPYRVDPTVTYTASHVLLASQSGTVVSNQGAAGSITFTLPLAASNPGCYFQFITVTAQPIVLQAVSGAVIQGSTGMSSVNGTVTSAAALYTTICIVSVAGNWFMRGTALGTWTAA